MTILFIVLNFLTYKIIDFCFQSLNSKGRESRHYKSFMTNRLTTFTNERFYDPGVSYNTLSRIIMITNPMPNPIVPRLECVPSCVSGISSSTTTYIMAPAANDSR